MKPRGAVVLAVVGLAALSGLAGSAPLPFNAKKVIYFGWDTLGASTEDVYRNREKFAATGFDGIAMPVDGKGIRGRAVISPKAWAYQDFSETIPKVREMVALKGLRESYAMVYWMSRPRLGWGDDAAWSRFEANMRVLCRVAKDAGLKGLFIDHEDYTGKPLFKWSPDEDASYDETVKLARRRGAQIFRAMFEAFPEGRIIHDRGLLQNEQEVYSHNAPEALRVRGDLWTAFLNGAIEALPPGGRFSDGNEASYGEVTADDYRARYFACTHEALGLVEPQLRHKYLDCLEMCFAKYFDSYLKPNASRTRFYEALLNAGYLTDEIYWIYGEKFSVINWDRPVHARTSTVSWNETFPDLARVLRVSVGDYSDLRELAAKGALTNLVSNPHCDAQPGRVTPAPLNEYVEGKDRSEGGFGYDAEDGCSRPGCLTLAGRGCYTFKVENAISCGDRVYATFAVKGRSPIINVVWLSENLPARWNWNIGYQMLARPSGELPNGWKRYEVCMQAPEGVFGIGFVAGGKIEDSPLKFDDIGVYRW